MERHQVVILGTGPSGLTAAIELGQAGLSPLVITGPSVGGTLKRVGSITNWPGTSEISGAKLAADMCHQAVKNGAILRYERAVSTDLTAWPFSIVSSSEINYLSGGPSSYEAEAVIIATGAIPRDLDVPGAKEYKNRGVFYSSLSEGLEIQDKAVSVLGNGDSLIAEAISLLDQGATTVHLILSGKELSNNDVRKRDLLLNDTRVQVHYSSKIDQLKGDGQKLNQVIVTKGPENFSLNVEALFLAIGSRPVSCQDTFLGLCDPSTGDELVDFEEGSLQLVKGQMTSRQGIFAVGQAVAPSKVVIAAGEGAKAASQVKKFLAMGSPLKTAGKAKASDEKITTFAQRIRPVTVTGTNNWVHPKFPSSILELNSIPLIGSEDNYRVTLGQRVTLFDDRKWTVEIEKHKYFDSKFYEAGSMLQQARSTLEQLRHIRDFAQLVG